MGLCRVQAVQAPVTTSSVRTNHRTTTAIFVTLTPAVPPLGALETMAAMAQTAQVVLGLPALVTWLALSGSRSTGQMVPTV